MADAAPPAEAEPAEPEREVIHPAADLAAAMPLFRRPFTPAAVSFKIQVNPKKRGEGQAATFGKGLVVVYIEARTAAERLNVVTPAAWEDDYGDLFPAGAKGFGVKCVLEVFDRKRADVSYVTAEDLGKNGDMSLKGVHSDAFKRVCVKFGIGAFLYFAPRLYVEAAELKMVAGKWYLPMQTEKKLRERYGGWLAFGATIERFGLALDHGDVTEAQGDIEAAPPEVEPEPDEQADGDAEASGDTDTDGAVAEAEAAHAEHEATAAPDADAEADAALAAAEDPVVRLRRLYADSACTKSECQAKMTQMGISDMQEASPEQIADLAAFFESRTPA